MTDYPKMYRILFNAITDALQRDNITDAAQILITAQQQTEEIYIATTEDE